MCKCTPGVKTPFCGKVGCEWPSEIMSEPRYPLPESVVAYKEENNRLIDLDRELHQFQIGSIKRHLNGEPHRLNIIERANLRDRLLRDIDRAIVEVLKRLKEKPYYPAGPNDPHVTVRQIDELIDEYKGWS